MIVGAQREIVPINRWASTSALGQSPPYRHNVTVGSIKGLIGPFKPHSRVVATARRL